MISRKALLISAPGGARGHAQGVNAYLETTKNFLLSPRGGAWTHDEIIVMNDPGLMELVTALRVMEADYTITYFSGEGFADQDGKRFLILKDGDFFEDTELLNRSEKQLVLVDSCHEGSPEDVFHYVDKLEKFELARKMYDKWIISCEPGKLILHASRQNTHSVPRKNPGIFTRKLLEVASSIPAVENRFNLKSILAAGNEIPDLLQAEGHEECPAISYENGNIKLPFAMAMPADKPAKLQDNSSAGNSGLALGLFLLGIFLSLD